MQLQKKDPSLEEGGILSCQVSLRKSEHVLSSQRYARYAHQGEKVQSGQ